MSNKKQGKYQAKTKRKKSGSVLVKVLLAVVVLLVIGIALLLFLAEGKEETSAVNEAQTIQTEAAATNAAPVENLPVQEGEGTVNLGYGIYVTDIGNYTGLYMEDGSDEILSNILMLVVQNNGAQDIQYAEITMMVGDRQANFAMTTLPVGDSVVLLEKERMLWDAEVDYSAILPKVENIAYFQEPISLREDQLKVQIVDGAINVTNISGQDIPGNIAVYYKNVAAGIYYGGITYRVTLEGGLKAGEIRQIMTRHASDTGSEIMFVTISQ